MTKLAGARSNLGLMALSLLLVMVGGCASTKIEPYVPNPPQAQAGLSKLRVAVVELENQSPPKEIFAHGSMFLPGVLYVNSYTQYTPTKFGACVASELQASELFSDVTYFPTWNGGPEAFQGYDIILSGSLRYDKRPNYNTMYGISFLFVFPVLMGAPDGWEDREVSFELWAAKTKSPGQIIYMKRIEFKEPSIRHGLYSSEFGWHAGEGEVKRSACPTELLKAPFLEVRQGLLSSVQH